MRMLYDVALDAFDKPNNFTSGVLANRSPSFTRQTSNENNQNSGKRSAVNSLNLNPPAPEPLIVHPGVIIAILQMLPSIKVSIFAIDFRSLQNKMLIKIALKWVFFKNYSNFY